MNTLSRGLLLMVATMLAAYGCSAQVTDAEYVERAERLISQRDFRGAVIELKNALSVNTDSPRARWLLGETYTEMSYFAGAEKELRRAQELGVNADGIVPLLARAYVGQRKFKELSSLPVSGLAPSFKAEVLSNQALGMILQDELDAGAELIDEALVVYPRSIAARTEMARVIHARGDVDGARALLVEVLKEADFPPAYSLKGDMDRLSNDLESAESSYGKAIAGKYNAPDDLLKRALVRIDLAKYSEAQQDIGIVLKADPKHFEANYARGLIHFRQQEFDRALPYFEESLAQNDDFLPNLFFLGATYYQIGQLVQAESSISRFYQRNPTAVMGRKLLAQIRTDEGRFTDVVELLEPVVQQYDKDAEATALLANALVKVGQFDKGARLFDVLVMLQPDSANAHRNAGGAWILAGDTSKPVGLLEQALRLDPKLAEGYETLARFYLQHGSIEDALAVVDRYKKALPGKTGPWNLEAAIRLKEGEIPAATVAFEKALGLDAADPTANNGLAALAIENKNFAEARRLYEAILAKDPSRLDTLMRLAMVHEANGAEEQMVQRLEQAVAAHPDAVQPRTSMARYLLREARPDQAFAVLAELPRAEKNRPDVLEIQGEAFMALGSYGDARSSFKRLVEAVPGSARAHYRHAWSLAMLKEHGELAQALTKVLELSPNHLSARILMGQALLALEDYSALDRQLGILKTMAPENALVIELEQDASDARQAESEVSTMR